tara:strand:+ start:156 stop:1319 length:1164 start_codon:yes stop_codon:yes gene_type:complete
MKTVLLRGPLLSMSGYGTHSRQVFRWLKTQNVNVKTQILPWGITPWYINADSLGGLIGEIMDASGPMPSRPDVSFQVQLPNEWDPNLANFNVGITAAVETDKCNPEWISRCNLMHHVVVPSNHTKNVLQSSGNITSNLTVIPESFYDCILNNDDEENNLELNFSTDFNFLIFGQITGSDPFTDRKNTFFLIKWLCEEFKNDSEVGIVIKTNCGRNTSRDRENTTAMLEKLISEIRPGPFPRVYLLHGSLDPEEIKSIYKNPKIKALVSATRGEGYGLPLLESAACGLPVLATNWSGHLDFMNLGKFISFDYDLKPVAQQKIDGEIFIPGTRWAEVREADFKSKVRKFYKAPYKPKEWAEELSEKLKKEFSQNSINLKYSSVFSEILT